MGEFIESRLEFLAEGFLNCVFFWRNSTVFEQFGEFGVLSIANFGIEGDGLARNSQIVANLGGFDF